MTSEHGILNFKSVVVQFGTYSIRHFNAQASVLLMNLNLPLSLPIEAQEDILWEVVRLEGSQTRPAAITRPTKPTGTQLAPS